MVTYSDLVFDHITLPMSLLNQGLLRIIRGGWAVEHIAWDRGAQEVLILASTSGRLKPLEACVWAGTRSAAEAMAQAGVMMGLEKERG